MQSALLSTNNQILISDDKQADCVWTADGPDIIRWLHQTAELDDDWKVRYDLTCYDISVWLWARAMDGLPPWLRKGTMMPPATKITNPPYVSLR